MLRPKVLTAIGVAIGVLHLAHAQAPSAAHDGALPTFDVASVKPAQPAGPGRGRGGGTRTDPGMYVTRNSSLKGLVGEAYHVQAYQIVGGPSWLDTDAFDIEARTGHPENQEQMSLMLRALLIDRFKLTLHRDTKQLPIYALVIGKNGSKFHASNGGQDTPPKNQRNHLSFKDMPSLASALSMFSDRPIVDQTGLKGDFDLDLDMSKALQTAEPTDDGTPNAPMIAAVQEQFGLKVIATKGPLEVLVIDHAEKPSEN
jgi:uncharacterized protein (TIGR03435 family)